MVNKNQSRIRNTKKVLHKSGKNWITVSVVVLCLLGLGSAAGMTANADSTANQAPVVSQMNNNQANNSQSQVTWKHASGKMFVANKYPVYTDDWQKTGNTSKAFHKTFNVTGQMQNGKNTYYRLKNGTYTNVNALVNTNKTAYLSVPYVSQWRPISAPEGCAEASLEMLLRTDHHGVSLRYLYNHLPQAYNTKGGQAGNAYGTSGFRHVIKPYALARYGRRFDKNIKNISGASVNDIKMYVQSGHPVLYYGYSSYQLPGDPNRNHCKVITAYNAKKNAFLVYDPLYFSEYGAPGTQGRNMRFDRGARFWYSLPMFAQEYAHFNGSNKKCALVLMGKPHYAHVTANKPTARHGHHAGNKVFKSKYPSLKNYNSMEKALANKKFNYSIKVGNATATGRATMKADKAIDAGDPFNKTNYEKEYLYALNHPYLIIGAQDQLGGVPTGVKDGLNDYGQFAGVNSTKSYAKKHHESHKWLNSNLVENNKHGYYYWFFMGFNDVNGGDASNEAKAMAHQVGLAAYKAGLHTSMSAKKHAKPSRALLKFTMHHLSNTILSKAFQDLY
ncbi:C39 family peptidase [uncultured bacterium]|nr:C39 family peptidase [uncultured bacterium]